MYKIASNLKQLVRQLSAEKGKDYDLQKVADASGLTRVAISKIANNNTERVDYSTLAKLLAFFHREGLVISLSDLFTVTANEN